MLTALGIGAFLWGPVIVVGIVMHAVKFNKE